MPLQKDFSISVPICSTCDSRESGEHALKRKQSDDTINDKEMIDTKSINRLIRSNDMLLQTSFETLLEMVKAYTGIKECSEETQVHLNMVI